MTDTHPPPEPPPVPDRLVVPPAPGEVITSLATGTTYTMGSQIGEGGFGLVFECSDGWSNELAAKILKPTRPYEQLRMSAEGELQRLRDLRHPYITYVFDAFEYRTRSISSLNVVTAH